jgi:hypothetical protein
MLNGAM